MLGGRLPDTDGERCDRIREYRQGARISGTELLRSDALIAGAVITAFIGPAFASRLSEERLERVILVFLVCIGLALMIEGLLPQTLPGLLPDTLPWHIGAGVIFGLAIGLVSSLLGVTGGELIIPTLVFAFGQTSRRQGQAVSLSASQLSLWGCFGMRAVRRLLTAKP